MKKIIFMYAMIVCAGSLGMLLPTFFIQSEGKKILSEKYVYKNTNSNTVFLPEITASDDTAASESTEDAMYSKMSDLYSQLAKREDAEHLVEKGHASRKSLLETKDVDTLMKKVKSILEEADSFAGTKLSEKVGNSNDKSSSPELLVTSFIGMYIYDNLEFYEMDVIYSENGKDLAYSTSVVADAKTLKIYSMDGSIQTELNTDQLLESYRNYLGISRNRYENYIYSSSKSNAYLHEGTFEISLEMYGGYVHLYVSQNGYFSQPLPSPTQTPSVGETKVGG